MTMWRGLPPWLIRGLLFPVWKGARGDDVIRIRRVLEKHERWSESERAEWQRVKLRELFSSAFDGSVFWSGVFELFL